MESDWPEARQSSDEPKRKGLGQSRRQGHGERNRYKPRSDASRKELNSKASDGGYARAMASGVRLLAGREYSVLELTNKLCRRFSSDVVDAVVGELVGQSVLDDVRYGEAFCRSRVERGYGPSYIARELEQNGLNTDLVDTLLQPYEDQWFERALTQARKAHRPRSRPSTLDAMGCDEGFADDLNADEAFESSADLEPGEEWKDRQKARGRLARRLARRGFSAGLASKVIDQVLAEAESDFG